MNTIADRTTREIATSRFKLADDLTFTAQVHGNETSFGIESARQGTFYRIGYPEYVFVSLLDGKLTVAQALTVTARALGARGLSQAQGEQTVLWLLENGLASDMEGDQSWIKSNRGSQSKSGFWGRLNPFNMQWSCGSPDWLLGPPTALLGWLFSPLGMCGGVAFLLLGIWFVANRWDKFVTSAGQVFSPHNWLSLALCWIVLKAVHELGHAVACRIHGGQVRDAGLIFVLFAPMPYVDVTSCWRFPSRWQRIQVASAGMYVELLIAAGAALAWSQTDALNERQVLQNVIVSASLSTLLFNLNPLMRFDGYYILSDLLEIPNLSTDGQRFVAESMGRVFYGTPISKLQVVGFRTWCIRCYGLAAAVWRVMVCFSMAAGASVLFHGWGFYLAIGALMIWFGSPIWQGSVEMWRRFHESPWTCIRAGIIGMGIATVTSVVLLFLPWPATLTAPMVVEYADSAVVRAPADGFVERLYVGDGQLVTAGQLLVELRNDELQAQLREQLVELATFQLKHRIAVDQHDAAAAQIESKNLQAAVERCDDLRKRVDALLIRAPEAGRVVGRHLKWQTGTFLSEGGEIMVLGDDRRKQLTLSAGQEGIDNLVPMVGTNVLYRVGSRPMQIGQVERIEPRASLQLPHPAMSATAGGTLPVVAAGDSVAKSYRLTEPRFRGVVALSPEISEELGVGERGYVVFGWHRERMGEYLWIRATKWMESLLAPLTEASKTDRI